MATHDYSLANQNGSAFRSDLNNCLSAIQTMNSNATAPGTVVAYQFWADTNANLLKMRNAANDGWVTLRQLDGEHDSVRIESGSAGSPTLGFTGTNNSDSGLFSPGDDRIAVSTAGSQRFEVDASGRVLIGTTAARTVGSSNLNKLQIEGTDHGARIGITRWSANASGPLLIFGKSRSGTAGTYTSVSDGDNLGVIQFAGADGTDMASTGASISAIVDGTPGGNDLPTKLVIGTTADGDAGITDRVTIDALGNMLIVSESVAETYPKVLTLETSTETDRHAAIALKSNRGGNASTASINGDSASSGAGTSSLYYRADVGHQWFSGQTNQKMTLSSGGNFGVGKTTGWGSITYQGMELSPNWFMFCSDGGPTGYMNRLTDDGVLVHFYAQNNPEGDISVSGTTVSYNGAHLSRWSQFKGLSNTDKSARPTIYQGTVLSNLDDMCEWVHADKFYEEDILYTGGDTLPEGKAIGDIKHAKGSLERAAYTEENQQLNKTKVSDADGDKNVAGVFWAWDDDDQTGEYLNDFYVAMTGDMVIRVAGDCTVTRGDLLISAGDGTAKPQADDIIRSSTVAKITSTTSTATYADGSKAYPCVLMAC